MFGVIDVTDDTAFSTVFKASNTLQHVYSKTFITSLTVFFSMHIKLADQEFLYKSCKVLPDMSRKKKGVRYIKLAMAEFHLGFSVSGLWCDSCWLSGSDISI